MAGAGQERLRTAHIQRLLRSSRTQERVLAFGGGNCAERSGFPEHFDNSGSTRTRDFPTIAADPGPSAGPAEAFQFPTQAF